MRTYSIQYFNKQITKSQYFIRLILILSTLFLSACGGGGSAPGGNNDNNNNNAPTLDYPTNVIATGGDGQVTVSWNAVSGADTYTIYVNDNTYASNQSFIKTASTSSLSSTFTGLINAQIHTLVVYASNSNSTSYGSYSVQFRDYSGHPT